MHKIKELKYLAKLAAILLSALCCLFLGACRSTLNESSGFTLTVVPQLMDAIAGQQCVFLVQVAPEQATSTVGAVDLTATATAGQVDVLLGQISPGVVGEVSVIPPVASVGETVTVTIQGQSNGQLQTQQLAVNVIEGEDMLVENAVQIRDLFIPWLAANHPELNIDTQTEWNNTIVNPDLLIVANYLFFSDEWELGLSYHVMIAPHDWARIYLRHRTEESTPSYAYEITSLEAGDEPQPIDPPQAVYR